MITRRTRNLLEFIRSNVEQGVESVREARKSVTEMKELSEYERLLLGCALNSRAHLEEFCSAFKD
jgi:hypothetical protein